MMNVLPTTLLFLLMLFFVVFVIMFVIVPIGLVVFSIAFKFYIWLLDMLDIHLF